MLVDKLGLEAGCLDLLERVQDRMVNVFGVEPAQNFDHLDIEMWILPANFICTTMATALMS